MKSKLTNNEQVVGHRFIPLEQRLGRGAKTDTTLWIGGTKEFREITLLDMGGFAAVGNVGYQSAIQKTTTLWFLYPNFLKIVLKTNRYIDFIHKPLFESLKL